MKKQLLDIQFWRRSRWIALLVVALSASIALSACNQSDDSVVIVTQVVLVEGDEQVITQVVRQTVPVTMTPVAAAESESQPVVLDLSFSSTLPNIDPQQTADADGIDLIENLFVGLTNFNLLTNKVEPELAADWQVSDDGRTWTFNLRDDVYWVQVGEESPDEDGFAPLETVRPVVADDVLFALRRACQQETALPDAFILFLITGCERIYDLPDPSEADLRAFGVQALDEQTLQVTLVRPSSQFLTITTLPFFHPAPPELVREFGAAWFMEEGLWASGPFVRISNPDSTTRTLLQRNTYWPISNRGNVDFVNILTINNRDNAFQLWQAKNLDISPLPDEMRNEILANTPQKVQLISDQTVRYLEFNLASGVFREPEVRRAFSAAIDREQLVEEIYGGQAIPMRHLIPPGTFAASPIDEVGMGYDPDYARIQMAESGFRSCRLLPTITWVVSTSDLSLQQAELIRDMWVDELGCTLDQIQIEQVQFGTLLANTRQDAGSVRPDMWELAWAAYFPDAHDWVGQLLHCTESENRSARPCSQVDDLLIEAVTTSDPAQRVALYRQIETMLFARDGLSPMIPLYADAEYQLVQTWLTFQPARSGGEQYDTYQIDATLKRLEQSR